MRQILLFFVLAIAVFLTGCEPRAFQNAQSQNTEAAYKEYLDRYPNGAHALDAINLAEQCAFEEAVTQNTEAAYTYYSSAYPTGQHISEVKQLMEKCAFEKVKAQNTIKSLEKFLGSYPKGLCSKEAEAILEKLRKQAYWQVSAEAHAREKQLDWQMALNRWKEAQNVLSTDEAGDHIRKCEYKIANPVELNDVEAIGRGWYSGQNFMTEHWASAEVKGTLINNLKKPVYDIVIKATIYSGSFLGSGTAIQSAKRTLCSDHGLQPGESRKFSFQISLKANTTVGETTLTKDVELISYKVAR